MRVAKIGIRHSALIATTLVAALLGSTNADPGIEFYEKEVRPVLAEHCYSCHSAEAKKLKADLFVDSKDGMLRGGDSGPVLVPGDPEASLLIQAVRYDDPDMEMPPKLQLSDEIVATLEQWITMGAPMPEGSSDTSGREAFNLEQRRTDHWCWQPVAKVTPTAVDDAEWNSHPIDQLVRTRLDEAGLIPSDVASPRIWLRRATLDITGLTPTPEELDAFEADPNYEAAVDRLLASPSYGEKWGRHWLDLVRYAESYGHEFDYSMTGPHHYRDYVIRALNADLPYDQFITEQVAGDLLTEPRPHPEHGYDEAPIGTAFWYLGEAVHAPTDSRGDEAGRMDNMVDVFGKTFLGLTISCARCHDHKFDAISTADYYAMTSYLQATRFHHTSLDPSPDLGEALWNAEDKAQLALRPMAKGSKPAEVHLPKESKAFHTDFPADKTFEEAGWRTRGTAFGKAPISIVGDAATWESGVAHSGLGSPKLQGTLRSPTFEIEGDKIHIRLKGHFVKGETSGKLLARVVIDGFFMGTYNALLYRGTHLQNEKLHTEGEYRWISLGGDLKNHIGKTAYLEFIDQGDGHLAIDAILAEGGGPPKVTPGGAVPAPSPALTSARDAKADIEAKLPSPQLVPGVDSAPAPESAYVHIRGKHTKLGEEVPARFLTALGGETNPAPDRLGLAQAVTDPANPLTSRVLVNRLWHHLFGRGIVPSVDDFGDMGQPPSNPELLDWLAKDLVDGGWSIKRSIRQIVLSRTYRMSSAPHPELDLELATNSDPENALLHRFPVRRMTAEVLRDSMLAVSGRLDPKQFGPGIPIHLTPFMNGRGRPGSGPIDGNGRRSIYLQIRRNFLNPSLLTFDAPSPFSTMGRRSSSNVPAQALALLNDPFVLAQAKLWAESVAKSAKTPPEQVAALFQQSLGRDPSTEEQADSEAFLTDGGTLADLAHVLFNHKEFLFIR